MNSHRIFLSKHPQLPEGATQISVPVKQHGFTLSETDIYYQISQGKKQFQKYIEKHSPYAIGDELWFVEWYRIVHVNHTLESRSFYTIQYKDFHVVDYNPEIQEQLKRLFKLDHISSIGDGYSKWRNPAKKFSRKKGVVTGVRLVKVKELTFDDLEKMGFYNPQKMTPAFAVLLFQKYWNNRSEYGWIYNLEEK